MHNPVHDLRQLAEEAAKEAPQPRAKRCWFSWSHNWTMWENSGYWFVGINGTGSTPALVRRCTRCGLIQAREIQCVR